MKRQLIFRDAEYYGANLIQDVNEFVRIIFSANLYPKNSPIVNIIGSKEGAIGSIFIRYSVACLKNSSIGNVMKNMPNQHMQILMNFGCNY